jgi:Protein of unknown function (DUF1403)
MRDAKTTVPPIATLCPVPAWSRVKKPPASDAEAAFAAGASLAALDAVVRSEPAFAGAWRQRLALSAAAATARLSGRREDEAALRDAWCFRTSGEDPGPASRIHRVWRQLAQRSTGWQTKTIEDAAQALGTNLEGRAGELIALLDTHSQNAGSPLAAVVGLNEAVVRGFPQAELLALMLADLVLAATMRWSLPAPLLMTQIANPLLRVGEPRRRPRPGEGGWPITLAASYALAATAAVDLAIDLERRAGALQRTVPKLRAKGAEKIVVALLDDDVLTPASAPGQMSDRALRRLFDRLVELGAVRELSGRPSFRVYGL